jgi:uncharacterized protein YmfQ (DUF2313 family)
MAQDIARQNFYILGKNLDTCEELAATLLNELWPNTTINLLEYFEKTFGLRVNSAGDINERRNRIIAAHRQRGGISLKYFEDLANKMGERTIEPYTVVITEGVGYKFIIHSRSPSSSPAGPATLLPGRLGDAVATNTSFYITITITGTAGPVTELETLFNRIKPAYCVFTYVYIV